MSTSTQLHHAPSRSGLKSVVGPSFSSLLGQSTYIGFYVDWSLEAVALISAFIILSAASSLFIGLLLYTNAMIADLNMRLMSIDDESEPELSQAGVEFWSVYVHEIVGYFCFAHQIFH